MQGTEALAQAHDRDRIEREKRRIWDETRAPEAAIKPLPGLTATGGATNRTLAAPALTALLARIATARGEVPPALAHYAGTLVQLAHMDTIPPEAIAKAADALSAESAPGAGAGRPDGRLRPGLNAAKDTMADWGNSLAR